MDEQLYTLAIYEHSDRHGRFVAWEIHAPGKRPSFVPAAAPRHLVKHRECVFHATRAADPQPDGWLERITA